MSHPPILRHKCHLNDLHSSHFIFWRGQPWLMEVGMPHSLIGGRSLLILRRFIRLLISCMWLLRDQISSIFTLDRDTCIGSHTCLLLSHIWHHLRRCWSVLSIGASFLYYEPHMWCLLGASHWIYVGKIYCIFLDQPPWGGYLLWLDLIHRTILGRASTLLNCIFDWDCTCGINPP
jgi:hypothetical protein